MKKKIISIILLAVMILILAAGCGSKKDVSVLKVYIPNMAGQIQDLKMVNDKANEILAEKIGAKIELIFIDVGAYTEKMNMKLASNEEFDLCFTSSWLNPYDKAVKNGSYYPLTDLINENCPDLWDTMEDYWWEGAKIDGELYAVPNQQIIGTIPAVTLSKHWVDKYNLDIDSINKVEDLEPFFATIKKNEPDVYPYRVQGPIGNEYPSIISCVSLDTSVTDGYKAVFAWDEPGYEDSLAKVRDWFKKGYIRQDIASCIDDNNDFKANKYVVTHTGWKPGFEASQAAQLGGEHAVILLKEHAEIPTGGATGTMWAISANTKHPVESIKFLNEVQTNVELYNLLCFGIEGEHYEWIDEDHIRQKTDGGYFLNQAWAMGNQFNAYVLEGQDADVWEQTKKLNSEAVPSRLYGFTFDNSKVQMELSQCETVMSEFKNIFNGSADYTELLPQYKDRMMKAGAQNILDEVQRQLDEFAKSQK